MWEYGPVGHFYILIGCYVKNMMLSVRASACTSTRVKDEIQLYVWHE